MKKTTIIYIFFCLLFSTNLHTSDKETWYTNKKEYKEHKAIHLLEVNTKEGITNWQIPQKQKDNLLSLLSLLDKIYLNDDDNFNQELIYEDYNAISQALNQALNALLPHSTYNSLFPNLTSRSRAYIDDYKEPIKFYLFHKKLAIPITLTMLNIYFDITIL